MAAWAESVINIYTRHLKSMAAKQSTAQQVPGQKHVTVSAIC